MARIYLAMASAVLFFTCQEASAQICKSVVERTGEVGCWIIAHHGVSTAKLKKSAFTYRDEAREEMI